MNEIVLTGDRPTGPLHLGHYVGSLLNRVFLQKKHKQYVMIADLQALTDNYENPDKIKNNILEVIKDYLAVGIDHKKTTIFLQSQITEITELTFYFLNLVTLGRLQRNPTVKTEIHQKGFDNSLPMGFLCYPVSQAADITIFKSKIVPVGDDQLPMIEQTNEIVRKFNRIYNCQLLLETEAYLSNSPRLVGIDGKAKASKSLGNAIFLSDSAEEIKKKVFSMYTDPDHLKVSDPGKIEGNVVFNYLDIFYENKEELEGLKKHYQKGGLGDVSIKNMLNQSLQKLLEPIRDKRSSLNDKEIKEILEEGTIKAKIVAKNTMQEIREAICITNLIF